jgi:hypothetical protein
MMPRRAWLSAGPSGLTWQLLPVRGNAGSDRISIVSSQECFIFLRWLQASLTLGTPQPMRPLRRFVRGKKKISSQRARSHEPCTASSGVTPCHVGRRVGGSRKVRTTGRSQWMMFGPPF